MAGMAPAFMNQPQYQQQMQNLAMQVRQQEEGTKKIKKFLKAYEDIQLSAPMGQAQAPMQPGFMGGGGQPPMMQPPGGAVASMNNRLPRNDMTEPAPTSFTQIAGGSVPAEGPDDMTSYSGEEVPPEPEYETANIGEEEAMGGVPPQKGVRKGDEWQEGLTIGDDIPPPTGRDKSEDKTPLEHRGDWDASRKTRQDDRKKMDAKLREKGKEAAIDKAIFGDKESMKRYDEIDAQMKKIEQDLIKKGSSYRTGDGAFGQKQWADTSVAPDFDTEEGKKVKPEYERLRAERNKARWAVEKARKSIAKLKQMSFSKPNKAMGIAGLASGLLAGASASANELFQPEDAEIFLGRISKDKDFNKLNAREKAAVQKFLEYKAESDSLPGRSGLPRNASDEPIEYSSAEKALMSQ